MSEVFMPPSITTFATFEDCVGRLAFIILILTQIFDLQLACV